MKTGTPAVASRLGLLSRARDIIELSRPKHWVKNVVVLAAPAAGLRLFSSRGFVLSLVTFAAFCLASSATYAINDAVDREADAKHPSKRHRPVARGAVSPAAALVVGGLLIIAAVLLALQWVNLSVALALLGYSALSLAYSLRLKHLIILDVIVIAAGFVMRAWAGGLAVQVPTSLWLVACVFTLCLFFGFGKRRCETLTIGDEAIAGQHRKTLLRYDPELLNHLLTVSAAIAILTFLLYTVDSSHPAPFEKQYLFYTLPVVIYGVFRFALITGTGLYPGPTDIVLKDSGIRAAVLIWSLAALFIAYQGPVSRAVRSLQQVLR